jgi:hypothetical protein
MKDRRIVELRNRAERDHSISDGALRLILRLASQVYTNPHMMADESFALPAGRVAQLCGLRDPEVCYRRIYELLPTPGITYGKHRKSYLRRVEKRGCPPTWYFKLNL